MSARRFVLPAWAATFAVVLAGASGLGLSTAPLAHADDPATTVNAVADTALTTPGTPVTVDPLANDTTEPADQLVATSVVFGEDQPPAATSGDGGKSLDVPAEGTYAIGDDGRITFTPVDGFDAVATPVHYTVSSTDGATGTATVTVTVHTVPVATDDAADVEGYYQFNVLDNDTSDAGAPLQPSTLRPAADQDPQLQVYGNYVPTANGGYYFVQGGSIFYSSGPSQRTGPDTPLRYEVNDADGRTTTALIRPNVITGGYFSGSPYQTIVAGIPTSFDALRYVYYFDNRQPDPSRLTFSVDGQPEGAQRSDDGRTLSMPGQWTFTIDPATGTVTGVGSEGYRGYAQVGLTLAGDNARTLTTTWFLQFAKAYVAVDDHPRTSSVRAVTFSPLQNDQSDYNNYADYGAVVFPAEGQPSGAVRADDGRSISVPGEGDYTVGEWGQVTFSPQHTEDGTGFLGDTSPVTYSVRTYNGQSSSARISVSVHAPLSLQDQSTTTRYGAQASVDLWSQVQDTDDRYDYYFRTSRFAAAQPAGQVSDDGNSLEVPGEGSWYLYYGYLRFTPADGFSGTTTPVTYLVDTVDGTATAHATVTVGQPPRAVADVATTRAGNPVEVRVTDNDTSDPEFPVDPWSVDFAQDGQPVGATRDYAWGYQLTVPGEGVYALTYGNGTAIRFTPADGFTGVASPIRYTVRDGNWNTATGTLTVTVTQHPVAHDDAASTGVNRAVRTSVLANDSSDPSTSLDPASVRLLADDRPGSQLASAGLSLTTSAGSYQVDTDTGAITFTPVNGFVGDAGAVRYSVADLTGDTAQAALSVSVHPAYTATDRTAFTPYAATVDVDLKVPAPVDPDMVDFASLRFADDQRAGEAADEQHTLVVPGEGRWTTVNGSVSFLPVAGFSGTTTPVAYSLDTPEGVTTAHVTVAVGTAPTAAPDKARTREGTAVTVAVLANDGADDRTPLDARTLTFAASGQPKDVHPEDGSLSVPGEGRYAIREGGITFTPATGFAGVASPIGYVVRDAGDNSASATLTVTVLRHPKAIDDTTSTASGRLVRIAVLANDAGDPNSALDPTTLRLQSDGRPGSELAGDGHTLTTTQGTYAVDGSVITFTPAKGYAGTTPAVRYAVDDADGETARASLTITVRKAVIGSDDSATTTLTSPVTIAVLTNDSSDASAPFDKTSVRFTAPTDQVGTLSNGGRTLTTKQGTYVAGSDGRVTFTAAKDVAGPTTPVRYQVANTAGDLGGAAIRVSVLDVITAQPDKPTIAWGTASSVNVLTNDTAVTKLTPSSVVFSITGQPAGSKLASGNHQLTVPGQATYVINATTGVVTVTPLRSVSGTTLSTVRYGVSDASGASTSAGLLTVTVKPAPGLAASADTASTKKGKAVTVSVLVNDHASPGSSFVASSVVLTGATTTSVRTSLTNGGKKLVVAGQGTYVVNASGSITFTPLATFTGAATKVEYKATDGNGLAVGSTLAVTVTR